MKKRKGYLIVFGVFLLAAGLLWWKQRQSFYTTTILRPAAGAGEEKIDLSVYGIGDAPVRVTLFVSPRILEEKELSALWEESWQQIQTEALQGNESFLRVEEDLYLPDALSNGVQVQWHSSDTERVSFQGQVEARKEDTDGADVTLTAALSFQGNETYRTLKLKVFPKPLSEEEKKEKEILDCLSTAEMQERGEDVLKLPETVGGKTVRYHRKTGEVNPVTLSLLGGLILVLFKLREKSAEKEREEKRKKQLQLDYAEVVTLLCIYLGAGLSIRNAWSAIVQEYGDSGRYCYEEMAVTDRAMKAGCFEGTAYQEFGRRTRLPAYIRLGNLLAQNLRKGPKSLLESLEAEMNEAFEERKRIARRLGEEAGTKLMMPMFLLFGIILLYIMVPIMMSLSI